ncbi:triacylglycerol lipase OBL1-like [Andrographis paniculata]|uniref:triacylglycerol lipase OBL1-like n=1 Tax=Andrographis paniculata TaxID=175694 RepID=UPI0021E873D1|nr:triacylglycerol lipase OBL1-like [Andrographis paniculata]
MAKNRDFSENYLVLKPEDATGFDLVRILSSRDFGKRDFFSSSFDEGELIVGFRQRWILLVSVFLQKILIRLKTPMAAVGNAVELGLNYPPANGGFCRLLFNFFAGRLVRPERSSETFTSIIGNLDKRFDLDLNFQKHHTENKNNNKYASLAIMASKLSYENQAFVQNIVTHHWQMEFLGFYSFWNDYQETNSTHAILFRQRSGGGGGTLIVVAFRGTAPFDADAWRTDIDISWHQFKGVGKIHRGFMKALGMQKSDGWPKELRRRRCREFAYYRIREELKTLISEDEGAKFILTGHSLGGALAVLFAGVLAMHEEAAVLRRLEGVYTFGQPRVGDSHFGDYLKAKMDFYHVNYYRYVYCNDLIPRLPYDDWTFSFKHFGPCLYFNSRYNGQVLEEEPNKNYFSLLHLVPMTLNAFYELLRGFILPWSNGDQYKEGWFMKLFRIMALVAPGLTNHCLSDYVNITRLGRLSLSPSSSIHPRE